jgi:hypothetical protein
MSTKGRSDYYAPGDYNACCDRCCAKFKASKLKRDWHGFMLCEWCWEPRHPQDFVRGLADPTPVPWVRMCCGDNFVTLCTPPVAEFTVEADESDPLTVHVTRVTTTPDPVACPVTCSIDFGDGTVVESCTASHTYAEGTYEIEASVSNDAAVDTQTLSFEAISPVISCLDWRSDTIITAGGVWPSYAVDGFEIITYELRTLWGRPYISALPPPVGTSGIGFASFDPHGFIVNINPAIIQVRKVVMTWLYGDITTFNIIVQGGGSILRNRPSSSAAGGDDWDTNAVLITSADLVANGYPTQFITSIVFNSPSSGWQFVSQIIFGCE